MYVRATKWVWLCSLSGYISVLNATPDGPYVDPLCLTTFFHNTYKKYISGMNGMNMWPSTTFTSTFPPLKRRILGRLKVKRIRDASEMSGKHTVSKVGKKVLVAYAKRKGTTRPLALKCQSHLKLMSQRKKIMQTQESVNMQGVEEDVVMGDTVEPQVVEVMRVNKSEQVVRVNEAKELVRVNQVVR